MQLVGGQDRRAVRLENRARWVLGSPAVLSEWPGQGTTEKPVPGESYISLAPGWKRMGRAVWRQEILQEAIAFILARVRELYRLGGQKRAVWAEWAGRRY